MSIIFYSKSKDYYWLSNFSAHKFQLEKVVWRTVEHYYQAQKYLDNNLVKQIMEAKTSLQARKIGQNRSLIVRSDWQSIKLDVMREAIFAKFIQNELIRVKLLETKDEILIHQSSTDDYWGDGINGDGLNMLGKIIMEVREQIQNDLKKPKVKK